MKRLLIFFIAIISLTAACKQNKQKSAAISKPQVITYKRKIRPELKYTSPILLEYASFLKSLDLTDVETSHLAAEKFDELFKTADAGMCDTALYIFVKHYKRQGYVLDSLQDKKDQDKIDSLTQPGVHISDAMLAYEKTLSTNGFRIAQSEGEGYIAQDFDFVAKHFYPKINANLKTYLQEINTENKVPDVDDGSIIITAENLVDRLIFWENFNDKYPVFIFSDAVDQENYYLRLSLNGSDDTDLIYNGKLDSFFTDVSSYLQKHYPKSLAAQVIPRYYQFILKHDTANAKNALNQYYKSGVLTTNDYITYGREY